jgi:tRNA A37 threonylcarbamoyladenosine biosynthesis protein TsaE
MKSLDFTELIRKKSVIAVEWAERVADFIREFDDEAIIIWLKIDYGQKEKERIITWGTL